MNRTTCTEKQNQTIQWFTEGVRGYVVDAFTQELYFDNEDFQTPMKQQVKFIKTYDVFLPRFPIKEVMYLEHNMLKLNLNELTLSDSPF